jgi:hypothetical protein
MHNQEEYNVEYLSEQTKKNQLNLTVKLHIVNSEITKFLNNDIFKNILK